MYDQFLIYKTERDCLSADLQRPLGRWSLSAMSVWRPSSRQAEWDKWTSSHWHADRQTDRQTHRHTDRHSQRCCENNTPLPATQLAQKNYFGPLLFCPGYNFNTSFIL